MSYFLGIDGGASKTFCLLGDRHSVLGSGISGPSNPIRLGEKQSRAALHEAINRACNSSGIVPSQIQSTCLGLAGAARNEISAPVDAILRELLPGELQIVGDNRIAHYAAFAENSGVVVIAGTGSIAYGRNHHGQESRAGGWGHAISDEGSGSWIGRAAVAAAFREGDENRITVPLLERILRSWNLEGRDALIIVANASPAPDFASLLPCVIKAADENDPVARSVLHRAGGELATLAQIAMNNLFARDTGVPVAMSGGVFRHCARVRDAFEKELVRLWPGALIKPEIADPARGALDLARRAIPVSNDS